MQAERKNQEGKVSVKKKKKQINTTAEAGKEKTKRKEKITEKKRKEEKGRRVAAQIRRSIKVLKNMINMIKKIEHTTELKIRRIDIKTRITTEETKSLKEATREITIMIIIAIIVTEITDQMVLSTKGMKLDELL